MTQKLTISSKTPNIQDSISTSVSQQVPNIPSVGKVTANLRDLSFVVKEIKKLEKSDALPIDRKIPVLSQGQANHEILNQLNNLPDKPDCSGMGYAKEIGNRALKELGWVGAKKAEKKVIYEIGKRHGAKVAWPLIALIYPIDEVAKKVIVKGFNKIKLLKAGKLAFSLDLLKDVQNIAEGGMDTYYDHSRRCTLNDASTGLTKQISKEILGTFEYSRSSTSEITVRKIKSLKKITQPKTENPHSYAPVSAQKVESVKKSHSTKNADLDSSKSTAVEAEEIEINPFPEEDLELKIVEIQVAETEIPSEQFLDPITLIDLSLDQAKSTLVNAVLPIGNSLQMNAALSVSNPKNTILGISNNLSDMDSSLSINPLTPKDSLVGVGTNLGNNTHVGVLVPALNLKKTSVPVSTTVYATTIGGQLNVRHPEQSTAAISVPVCGVPVGVEFKVNDLENAKLTVGLPMSSKINHAFKKATGVSLPRLHVSVSIKRIGRTFGFGRKRKHHHSHHHLVVTPPPYDPPKYVKELATAVQGMQSMTQAKDSALEALPSLQETLSEVNSTVNILKKPLPQLQEIPPESLGKLQDSTNKLLSNVQKLQESLNTRAESIASLGNMDVIGQKLKTKILLQDATAIGKKLLNDFPLLHKKQ